MKIFKLIFLHFIKLFKKIIIKIFLLIFIIIIKRKIKIKNVLYIKQNLDLKNIKKYFELNNNGTLINKRKFNKKLYPKISIICSVHNGENYILRFLRSIQNQFFNDIEIIFIDDYSIDNSSKKIEEYKKEDKRIILIKLKKNKGTLIARNIGILSAKGEFLIIPDVDDILSENILRICYYIAKKNNYDMIRFNMYSKKNFVFNIINDKLNNPIYQPELRNHLIYGLGYKKLVDGIISNKFIRRITYIKTLNNINIFYLKNYMIYFEDGLINFALHRNANSLYLLKRIGYFYIFNKISVSHSLDKNKYFIGYFIFLKFVLENLKNNKYEKDMVYFLLDEYIKRNEILYAITQSLRIYEEVINTLINDKFCDLIYKKKLEIMKKIINRFKKK